MEAGHTSVFDDHEGNDGVITAADTSGNDGVHATTQISYVGNHGHVGLTAQLYFVMCFLSCLAVVGSVGNAIVLYVFGKKKDKLTANVFIIALATVDFITCLVVIPFTVFMEFVNFYITDDVCCKLYMFLITSNIPFSALNMVAIAVDRYLCICHPFLHLMTVGRAKVLIACLALVAGTLGACVASFHGVYDAIQIVPTNAATANITAQVVDDMEGPEVTEDWTVPPYSWLSSTSADDELQNKLAKVFIVNVGECKPNYLLVDKDFQWYYQKLYTFMYPTCLTVVVVLYFLIYRSVQRRRAMRLKQKSKSLTQVKRMKAEQEAMMAPVELELSPMTPGTLNSVAQPSTLKPPLVDRASFDNGSAATDLNGCNESLLRGSGTTRSTSKVNSQVRDHLHARHVVFVRSC